MKRAYCVSFLLGLALWGATPSAAIPWQEARPEGLNGKAVGVMMATFDPVTLEHTAVIEAALATNRFEYIVVVPADFTPTKIRRTSTADRHAMLATHFKDHPRVLTVSPYEHGFPQTRGVIKKLKSIHQSTVIGVGLGMDLGSAAKNYVLSLLCPADSWLVLAAAEDRASLPRRLGGEPIDVVDAVMPGSSQVVRRYLKAHRELFSDLALMLAAPDSDLPVGPEVRQLIYQTGLYQKPASFLGVPYDLLRSSLPYLFKR